MQIVKTGNNSKVVKNSTRGSQRPTHLFPPLSAVEDLVRRDAEVREHFGDAASVHATVGSHVLLAAPVHVDLAHWGRTQTHTGTLKTPLSAQQKQARVAAAPPSGGWVWPLHWSPCRSRPHSSEPQWSQKVRTLKLWMLNLCGTLTLKRWEPTGCRGRTTPTSVFRGLATLIHFTTNATTWWPWGCLYFCTVYKSVYGLFLKF